MTTYVIILYFCLILRAMGNKTEWFEHWFDTSYYHLLYDHRNDEEAEFFMKNLLDHLDLQPGNRILDLPCGKGRHAVFLHSQGFDVVGADISENSIKEAKNLENEQLHFDIYREGSHIGTHTLTRSRVDDKLVVDARTRISVRLLGFEIYRFEYDARETWDERGLLQLATTVDDDGEMASLSGQRTDDRFVWTDGRTTRSHAMPVYPTNHWNAGVLAQKSVLNTLSGKINNT